MWLIPRWVVYLWDAAGDILVEIVVLLYGMQFNMGCECLVNIAVHCGLK